MYVYLYSKPNVYTQEFCNLTKDAYGGDIIRQLMKQYS